MSWCVLCYRVGRKDEDIHPEEILVNASILFSICTDSQCLDIFADTIINPENGYLDENEKSFQMTILNKIYTFPVDKRIIKGIPNKIREIYREHERKQQASKETNQILRE